MKKVLGCAFCSFIIWTSAAVSDSHLGESIKFLKGETWASCVYGPDGQIELSGNSGNKTFTERRSCGSGWEGIALYQARIDERFNRGKVWDLQTAYNCCVYGDDPRAEICSQQHNEGASSIPWSSCGDYLDTMRGNAPGGVSQPEANEAVLYACIRAISGVEYDYKEWFRTSEYQGNTDRLFEACKDEDVLAKAMPYTFDFLRDYTKCLWNNPYDDFCVGSRRNLHLNVYRWKNTE
jgi:hypothetical protein